MSVSRIPDPRSTQAGRPRTGGRRLQSSWLRRLGGPRPRKRRLRRLHGGAALTLLFNITLVLSPSLLFPGIEVSCRHFPPNGSWISHFFVFFTVPFSSFSRVILKEAIPSILHEIWGKNDTPMSVKPKKVQIWIINIIFYLITSGLPSLNSWFWARMHCSGFEKEK